MPVLEVNGICKSFGSRRVLERISLRVERGNSVALVGPSGCGKTTLLRIIAGLESADGGEVWIGQSCVASPRIHKPPGLRNVGMVFQDLALWPHMRAWKHLEFVLRGRLRKRADRIRAAQSALEQFDLGDRAEAYPAEMSGGEQQRLAFARALIADPPLLLLDEPFANLNSELRDRIVNELERRMHECGVAIVVATHDPEQIERIATAQVRLGENAPRQK